MITRSNLRALRNDLPMTFTFRKLGHQAPYSKDIEGRFRFVCPHCAELLAILNPRNNLAHCFNCRKNINNIDLLLLLGYGFRGAVQILEDWLRLYTAEKKQPGNENATGPAPSPGAPRTQPQHIGQILQAHLLNHAAK
jgi:hypothetical protein